MTLTLKIFVESDWILTLEINLNFIFSVYLRSIQSEFDIFDGPIRIKEHRRIRIQRNRSIRIKENRPIRIKYIDDQSKSRILIFRNFQIWLLIGRISTYTFVISIYDVIMTVHMNYDVIILIFDQSEVRFEKF